MVYKKVPEYLVEDNKRVNLKKLGYHKKGEMLYVKAREVIVRGCNDVFIEYNGGILLVIRQDKPAKGELWPIGGGIKRGVLLDSGRGATYQSSAAFAADARSKETSKKKSQAIAA